MAKHGQTTEGQTTSVRVTSVSGAKATPHVKQSVEVDGTTVRVGDNADLTEGQVSRLKAAGVNFGEPTEETTDEGGEQ